MGTPTPAGPVFRLNSLPSNSDYRSVATLKDGTFVFVWVESERIEPEDAEAFTQVTVRAQKFHADGTKLGSEMIVGVPKPELYSEYYKPTVAALSDGGFAVSYVHQYTRQGTEEQESDLYNRIYKADGTAGPEYSATESLEGTQAYPEITPLKDGGFVMIYETWSGSDSQRIQRYAADGSRIGEEIIIRGEGGEYDVASLNDGFIVVGRSWDSTQRMGALEGYIFKSNGSQIKFEFGAPAAPKLHQMQTTVTELADGRFVVAWMHWDQDNVIGDGSLSSVRAQIFNADGTQAGSDFQVNVKTEGSQRLPKVAALPNGGFAVAYEDVNIHLPAGQQDLTLRVVAFNRNGTRDGDEVVLTTGRYPIGPENVDIAALADGRLIATWSEKKREANGAYSAAQVLDPRVERLDWSGSDDEDNYVGTVFDDTLKGMAGKDRLYGNNGSDTLDGGAGADSLDGGAGFDVVSYASATSRVDVDLSKKAGSAGDAAGDVLKAVEGIVGSGFDDKLVGDGGANLLKGGNGSDTLEGGGGGDSLDGGAGIDVVSYAAATSRVDVNLAKKAGNAGDVLTVIEGVVGSDFDDKLVGDGLANLLEGGNGKDDLQAGSGHDKIWGGAGNDSLKGGSGKDVFVFDTKANTKTNKDKIVDFKVKDDSIWLDNAIFAKLGKKGTEDKPAQISKSFFTVGSKAKDKNDYLIYDKAKGVLYYDADGSGKGKAVEVATLSKKLAMTYKDFFVI